MYERNQLSVDKYILRKCTNSIALVPCLCCFYDTPGVNEIIYNILHDHKT